jgi:hypothetical protein
MADLNQLLQQELSKLLSVTRMSVNRWAKEGMPKNPNGTYPGPACVAWLITRMEDRITKEADAGSESEESLKWLGAFRKERALIAGIERKRLQGEFVPESEVVQQWAARVREVTGGLETLADRLSGILIGKGRDEIHQIIRTEVGELRDAYARNGKYTPEVIDASKTES